MTKVKENLFDFRNLYLTYLNKFLNSSSMIGYSLELNRKGSILKFSVTFPKIWKSGKLQKFRSIFQSFMLTLSYGLSANHLILLYKID
jgi:hypothetical protein